MPVKRGAEDPAGQLVPVPQKKQRNEMIIVNNASRSVVESNVPRSSNMDAPIMLLSGHGGEVLCLYIMIGQVYTGKFHPGGNILASAGFDRQIYLWNV
jgi:Prp8 binding protein